jgi:hypothetical protein
MSGLKKDISIFKVGFIVNMTGENLALKPLLRNRGGEVHGVNI